MKGRIALLVGGAAGYVLGTKAGRERYEQIKSQAQSVWTNPKVQDKATQAQDFAKEKAPVVKDKAADAAAQAASAAKGAASATKDKAASSDTDPSQGPTSGQPTSGAPMGTTTGAPYPTSTNPGTTNA